MAETTKLSVEKALKKLRESDAKKAGATRHDEKIDALEDEIKRLRTQRVRVDAHQRRSPKRD
jgi:TolA-binding protein